MKRRHLISWLLAIALVFMGVVTPQVAFAAPSNSVMPGEMIIAVENNGNGGISMSATGAEKSAAALSVKGFKIKSSLHGGSATANKGIGIQSQRMKQNVINTMGYVYLVDYRDGYSSYDQAEKALRKQLQEQGLKVKYIEPNYRLKALGIVKPAVHTSQQWHYNMIKAPEAWNVTQGSSAVKIAVLDTGIDNNHASLRNFVNMSLAKNFTSDATSDTMDRQGHGTHVAGTIASYGVVSGVMKNATLVPVKVLGDDGSGSLYGIEQGILYAAEIGADVINMSLGGGGYAQSMADACKTASQSGTVVVAATGNDGQSTVSYPGAYPYVIGVGSVSENRYRSSFSNYGTGLDVMAPGDKIYSTYPNNQYKILSGTSMATPHVAGVCGLIRSVNKSLTPQQVEDILKTTAQSAGSSYEYGSGIVNAHAAVLKAGGDETPVDKKITATVGLSKTTVYRGESVTATATVKDQNGAALSGATVAWTVTRADGSTATASGQTNASGVATYTYTASSSDSLGSYQVQAQVSMTGYTGATASGSFTLKAASNVVTVTGYSYTNLKRSTSYYYGYTLYKTSATIYINLSDGTNYLHGTVSSTSWYGYPTISKTISGNAKAASTGQYIPYNLTISISPR